MIHTIHPIHTRPCGLLGVEGEGVAFAHADTTNLCTCPTMVFLLRKSQVSAPDQYIISIFLAGAERNGLGSKVQKGEQELKLRRGKPQ